MGERLRRTAEIDTAPVAVAERSQAGGRLNRTVRWSLRTRALPPVPLVRRDWLSLVLAYVLTRAAVILLGVLGSDMFPQVGPNRTWILHPIDSLVPDTGVPGSWLRLFIHFDSGWYLGISDGYLLPSSGNPDWLREWAFFPLYPWVVHPVSVALALLHIPGNMTELAAVLVSNAALFGALIYLYRLAKGELGARAAPRAILYLLLFPTSLLLSAVYPESLFLLLSLGAFYHTRRRQWELAGLAAAGALLTHAQGLLLVLPLSLEFLAAYRADATRAPLRLLRALWLALPFVALGGYALYSHAATGYWLAFQVSENTVWARRLTPPIYPLVRFLINPTLGGAFNFDFRVANFAAALLMLALVFVALRRLPPAYGLWLALGVLFPLSAQGGQLTAFTRFALAVFPTYLALAAWSLRLRWRPDGEPLSSAEPPSREARDHLVLVPFALLLTLFVVMFTNGVLAAV